MNGADEIEKLKSGGFTDTEITDFAAQKAQTLKGAGFSDDEINSYFGNKPFNFDPMAEKFGDNLKSSEKPVTSFTEALEAGWQQSVSGLVSRGKKPDLVLPEDASRTQRIAASVAGVAGDVPAMVGGFMVGGALGAETGPGAAITGMAGAFALPTALRETLMDSYEKGSFTNFSDFWDRASGILIDTSKGWVTGAATGAAGVGAKALPAVGALASPTVRAVTQTAAEVGTMVTVGKALEGQVPNADDFIDAAIAVGGLKASGAVAGKLRDIYREKGIPPSAVIQDANRDVTITQDLLSADKQPYGVPEAPPAETAVAKPTPEAGSIDEAQQKILSHISVGEEYADRKMSWSRLYTSVFDKLYPIKEAIDAVGGTEKASEDPYIAARLMAGVSGKADHMLNYGTFDFKTMENNGPSLKAILEPIGNDLDGFRAYSASVRALELEGRGVKTGFDLEAAQQVSEEGAKTYGPAMKEIGQYQSRVAAYLRDSGVMSKDAYAAMLDANKLYIPFQRVMDDQGPGIGTKSLQASNPVKGIKGSMRTVIDPIESVIRNTYLLTTMAEKNAVGTKLVDLLKKSSPEAPDAPAADSVRFYHGGHDPTSGGSRWMTPDRAYAEEYAKKSGGEVHYVDIAKDHPSLVKAFEDEGSDVKSPFVSFDAPADLAKNLRPLSGAKEDVMGRGDKTPAPMDTALTNFLKDEGVKNPEALSQFIKEATKPAGQNEIRIFRNGKAETHTLDPELARSFKGLDVETANMLEKFASMPASWLRAGATLTPDFIARNLVRDFQSAFVNSTKGFFSPVDSYQGLKAALTKNETFQEWLKSGGANAMMVSMDRRYMQDNLEKLTQTTGLMSRAWNVVGDPEAGFFDKTKAVAKLPGQAANKYLLDPLRAFSQYAEMATRLGEFKGVMEQQQKDGSSFPEALAKAGYSSREVTLDFARIGAGMRAMNLITAFFNAQVQGADRLARAFIDSPASTGLKIGLGVTTPSVLLWWANHDDPDYKEIPDWEKDMFWILPPVNIPGFGKTFIRIPKPFETGVMFGSSVERALDMFFDGREGAYKKFADSMIKALMPSAIPTIGVPFLEQFANRSTFTDRTLIPADMEKHLPEYQYTPYTTEVAKKLGQIIGAFPGISDSKTEQTTMGGISRSLTSPILIENYLRAWTGNLGTYALNAADSALRAAGVLPDPPKPASTLADIPFVKAFVVRYPSASAQSIQDFHDTYAKQKIYYDTWMAKLKEGDIESAERIQAAGGPMMFAKLDGIDKVLTEQNKMVRDIYKNPAVQPEEKRQLIDTIYGKMIELSRDGNAALRQIEKAMKPQPKAITGPAWGANGPGMQTLTPQLANSAPAAVFR